MQILVEQSGHEMTNIGDVAMAQIAVTRLKQLWPAGLVGVVTSRPDRLAEFCPAAFPVSAAGEWRWLHDGPIFEGPLVRSLPRWIRQPAGRLETRIRRRWPRFISGGVRLWERMQRPEAGVVDAFFTPLRTADLLVISGAGHLTSSFEGHALQVLDLLRLGRSLGARTVLFGQGLGPVVTPQLWEALRAVLPHVDLICLREKRSGLGILDAIGVRRERVLITGDDAIEPAYAERTPAIGSGLGVSLRRAVYSGVRAAAARDLRPVLHEAACRHSAALIPLPVALGGATPDALAISEVIGDLPETAEGPVISTPTQLIRQIGRCRVVVTGSYHGAVFALAQGIPAVGLAASAYYVDKFLGLADMFGGGCELVRLDDADFPELLRTAIDRAWRSAGSIRPALLEAAVRQVGAGQAAYARCRDLLEGPSRGVAARGAHSAPTRTEADGVLRA